MTMALLYRVTRQISRKESTEVPVHLPNLRAASHPAQVDLASSAFQENKVVIRAIPGRTLPFQHWKIW